MTIAVSSGPFSSEQHIQYRSILEEIAEQPSHQQAKKKWHLVFSGEMGNSDSIYTCVHTLPPRPEEMPGENPGWRILHHTWKNKVKDEIDDLFAKANFEDWDGEGASALTQQTVTFAKRIADQLPGDVGKPEVDVGIDGEVDFDWSVGEKLTFLICALPTGKIGFSGVFDEDTHVYGTESWEGSFPKLVDCCFERLREAQAL